MTLPDASQFNSPTVTENQYKEAQAQLIDHIKTLAAKTEVVEAVVPKADQVYVENALSSFQNGAIKTYPTLAAANADIANIALNTKVSVLSESDGGDYYKATASATSLTKSAYDPVVQSKEYTNNQVQKKQNTVNADTLTVIDFSAYLKVGNVGTTGLLENTNFAYRCSIINYPVDPSKFYLIRNTADLLSNLRIAWFDSSNTLLSIATKSAGQMSDLLLTPVANAAFVSIGLKSGNTDNVKYDETKVAFYSSTSADLSISKINAWDVRDSRVPAIQQKLSDIDKIVFGYKKVNTWLQYGIGSTGQVNTEASESHTDYISVVEGGIITSDLLMYRVNLYNANQGFISQGGFTGGNSFTIPQGLNVAYVRVTCQKIFTANPTILTVYNKLNAIEQLKVDVALKQSYIKPDSVTVIDFSAYLQNGNIGTTGDLESNDRRRSIVKMPAQQSITYLMKNNSDLLSNLRVAWFDSNLALLSTQVLAPAAMSNWQFTAPANAAFVSITLKSGNTDSQIYDASKVIFYSSTNAKFTIEQINGYDLAGGASEALQTRIESLETNAVKNISVGGTFALKNGNVVTIDAASAQKSGLMSAADKAKLDTLINGNITINGSGVTKNAAAYGFLPTKNAAENVAAMKAAVAGGGLIIVDYPGVYDVNESIPLESNTAIIFGPKVYINKVSFNGKSPRYTFINKGAYTREWNENIILKGLKIKCNGIGNGGDGTQSIAGLRGHVAMFYVRNLLIDDFELLDGDAQSYVIHVCTFENIMISRPRIEGYKDAIHLGNGKTFVIRDGQFRTYDDPIALNAHDYATGQPELGWVENGLIENCYDLDDPVRGTTGYFARILAGAWVDWFSGMQVQQSDTVVASNGKMYRVSNGVTDPVTYYTSTTEPSHASGNATLDGIVWTMAQENGVTHTVGVRNVKFKDIFLQKKRDVALSIHFDNGRFSRSYYPNAPIPIQENIIFESIHMQAEIPVLLSAVTPVKNIKVLNSEINKTKFNFTHLTTAGLVYNPVNILMMGNTFTSTESNELVTCSSNRAAKVKILGSIKENDSYNPTVSSNVTILSSDL